MLLDILMLVAGTVLVLWGADRFTDGACAVARRWGVSELIIGLTVVAMGTSLPEFVVSLFSALGGNADMSVGNVTGSNIFNTLIIVGASALVLPMAVDREITWRQMPLCLVPTVALVACGMSGVITRWAALGFCGLFLLFMAYSVWTGLRQKAEAGETPKEERAWAVVLWLVVGAGALLGGGQLLVHAAADIAREQGVSEAVIGLTILAGGTSLPELATSVVAARKGASGLALGNAIGSNIFNICLVLGICGTISPMTIGGLTTVDWATLMASIVVLWVMCFFGRLGRIAGLILLLGYAAYLTLRLLG